MGTLTPNYNIYKPDAPENYDVAVVNANNTIIDTQLKTNADAVAAAVARLDIDLPATWPRAKIAAPGAQTFTHNVAAVVDLATQVYDSMGGTMTEEANDRIKIPVAGWYVCCGRIPWVSNATGDRKLLLRKNTVTFWEQYAAADPTTNTIQTITSEPTLFAANDLIDLFASQSSGGNLDSASINSGFPSLSVHFVGGV